METKILGNRYKIIQSIAQGGFGSTYLAEDTQRPGNPKCVVKQLDPHSNDINYLKIAKRLFNKEAKTLEKLGNHGQIPRLLAYFVQKKQFYLVQEYIEGEILNQEINSSQPWTETKIINFLQDLLQILTFIHSHGVIHRDIKPSNLIRRCQDNKLVLVDFGAVKEVLQAQTDISSTIAIGTRGYMPIEQARGKPRFSSDIFATGMIAIQALTGIHPLQLQEDNNGEIVWQELTTCNPQLAAIISKMVCNNFHNRYQSAQEILANLSSLNESSLETANIKKTNKSFNFIKSWRGVALGILVGSIYLVAQNSPTEKQLKIAEKLAKTGQYSDAIVIIKELSLTPKIQKQIDSWSEPLLEQAETKYTIEGDIETAKQIINDTIPDTSKVKIKGQELLKQWEYESDKNQILLIIAEEDLQNKKWQNAKNEVGKFIGNSPFWQQQAQNINKKADLGIKSNGKDIIKLCQEGSVPASKDCS